MKKKSKILFLDQNETKIEIFRCIALALRSIPPIDIIYVKNDAEALVALENASVESVVIKGEDLDRCGNILEKIDKNNKRLIVTFASTKSLPKSKPTKDTIYILSDNSLESFHACLLAACKEETQSKPDSSSFSAD